MSASTAFKDLNSICTSFVNSYGTFQSYQCYLCHDKMLGVLSFFSIIRRYHKKNWYTSLQEIKLGPSSVVQSSDNTIQRINRHPTDM